jgi:hypothetical protein
MAYFIYYHPKQGIEHLGYYLCSDFAMTPVDSRAFAEITSILPKYTTVHESGFAALKEHMAANARVVRGG